MIVKTKIPKEKKINEAVSDNLNLNGVQYKYYIIIFFKFSFGISFILKVIINFSKIKFIIIYKKLTCYLILCIAMAVIGGTFQCGEYFKFKETILKIYDNLQKFTKSGWNLALFNTPFEVMIKYIHFYINLREKFI